MGKLELKCWILKCFLKDITKRLVTICEKESSNQLEQKDVRTWGFVDSKVIRRNLKKLKFWTTVFSTCR